MICEVCGEPATIFCVAHEVTEVEKLPNGKKIVWRRTNKATKRLTCNSCHEKGCNNCNQKYHCRLTASEYTEILRRRQNCQDIEKEFSKRG